MANYIKQTVGIGTISDDGTGDGLKAGAIKWNQNFDQIFASFTFDSSTNVITSSAAINITGTLNSGAITSTGICDFSTAGAYFGTAAAANLLDDYEEGLWTPNYTTGVSGITYDAVTSGQYVKIGKQVIATGYIRTDALTVDTAGSYPVVAGLPFTVGSVVPAYASAMSNASGFAGDTPCEIEANISTTQAQIYYRATSNGASTLLRADDLGTGSNANSIRFVLIYNV